MSKIKAFFKRLFTFEDEREQLPSKDPPATVVTENEAVEAPIVTEASRGGSRFIPPALRR